MKHAGSALQELHALMQFDQLLPQREFLIDQGCGM